MNIIKASLIAIVTLSLGGCVTNSTKLDITTAPVKQQKLVLPTPDEFIADPVKWYILSKKIPAGQKGSIEYFWKIAESSGTTSGLVLTPQEFKKLAKNQAKLKAFILQQKAIIEAYKKFYEANK